MPNKMSKVEIIARIIDPDTFHLIEHYNSLDSNPDGEAAMFKAYPDLKSQRDTARTKAAAILSAITTAEFANAVDDVAIATSEFADTMRNVGDSLWKKVIWPTKAI